jgi:uncharacterized protein YjbJ (UPF0337 family)
MRNLGTDILKARKLGLNNDGRQKIFVVWKTFKRRMPMNADQIKGKWKQLKGAVKTKWGELTDDDIDVINGQSDELIGKIQERYGIARDEAQRQVDEWDEMSERRVEEQRRAS